MPLFILHDLTISDSQNPLIKFAGKQYTSQELLEIGLKNHNTAKDIIYNIIESNNPDIYKIKWILAVCFCDKDILSTQCFFNKIIYQIFSKSDYQSILEDYKHTTIQSITECLSISFYNTLEPFPNQSSTIAKIFNKNINLPSSIKELIESSRVISSPTSK